MNISIGHKYITVSNDTSTTAFKWWRESKRSCYPMFISCGRTGVQRCMKKHIRDIRWFTI